MRYACAALLGILTTAKAFGQCFTTSDYGIYVAPPKVYDDYFLQTQLTALKNRLASINAADQATLLSKLGQVQGASMNQSGVSVQGLGPAPSQVTSLTAPATLPAYATPTSGATAPISLSGAYGTTTTGPTLTPSIPTLPASTLALPSSFSPSSLDTLNEEMQLSAQIIDMQLLLDGALSDLYIPGSQVPKRRVTVGLNISIDPCETALFPGGEMKRLLKDHLAEVEVEIQNGSGSTTVLPSIITLLPRDKTYNVASLSDKSISAGVGGILGGVFSVGAGWLWDKQKYYLVQQQDTIAIDKSSNTGAKFVWQFRPVLGQGVITAGTRQNFVQIALPNESDKVSCAKLIVKTRWRKLDVNSGLIGPPEHENGPIEMMIPYFDLTNPPQQVTTRDMGGGFLDVRILGIFQEGTAVRIGGTVLVPGSPNLSTTGSSIEFIASGKDLITGGAYLISRDGEETPVGSTAGSIMPSCAAKPTSSPASAAGAASVTEMSIYPYSDTQSILTFTFTENTLPPAAGSDPRVNPIIASLGDQVFGLQNAPFRSLDPVNPQAGQSNAVWKISVIVPSNTLRLNDSLRVQRLFAVEGDSGSAAIPLGKYPKVDFSVDGLTLVALATRQKPTYKLLATGSGLDKATLEPSSCVTFTSQQRQGSYTFVDLKEDCKNTLKVIVFSHPDMLPIVLPVPKLDASASPDAKAAVDPLKATVAPGSSSLILTGPGLDQITSVRFGKNRLAEVLGLDKKSASVALTPDIVASEGIRYLEIATADGKKLRFELTVKNPNEAR